MWLVATVLYNTDLDSDSRLRVPSRDFCLGQALRAEIFTGTITVGREGRQKQRPECVSFSGCFGHFGGFSISQCHHPATL